MRSTFIRRGLAAAIVVTTVLTAEGSASAHAADSGMTFSQADVVCAASAGRYEPAPLQPVADAWPLFYRPSVPVVDSLLNAKYPETSAPDCPAEAATATEHARADATIDATAGRWSMDLSATSKDVDAFANAIPSLGFMTQAESPSDLVIHFDEIEQHFATSCSSCSDPSMSGVMITIFVHSSSGSVWADCGVSASSASETSFTLPDDRCGRREDGSPARLSVGTGDVDVQIAVSGFAGVSGSAPGGPPIDAQASTSFAGRVGGYDFLIERAEPAQVAPERDVIEASATEIPVEREPFVPTAVASSAAVPGAAATRPVEDALPPAGYADVWLARIAIALIIAGAPMHVVSRRHSARSVAV